MRGLNMALGPVPAAPGPRHPVLLRIVIPPRDLVTKCRLEGVRCTSYRMAATRIKVTADALEGEGQQQQQRQQVKVAQAVAIW